jgi:hypothetical protein
MGPRRSRTALWSRPPARPAAVAEHVGLESVEALPADPQRLAQRLLAPEANTEAGHDEASRVVLRLRPADFTGAMSPNAVCGQRTRRRQTVRMDRFRGCVQDWLKNARP